MPQAVSDSFNVMIPMLLTLSIFGIVSAVLAVAFSTDLMTIISTFISEPLKGIMNAGPWAVVLIYTLANLLFCLGIHQSTISGVLAEPILTILIVDNMATFASGQPIPADHYMNMQIIYLLGVGRFYTYNFSSTEAAAGGQSQSSVAMKSFLSSTLSSQLNDLIAGAMGYSNWSFGTNLSTGQIGWSDMEVAGLLSGHLLNNRLLINGNFGYRDRPTSTTNFVGDFDIQYLLTPSGSVSLKAYSETNDRYFTKSALTTQGIGIRLSRDFTNLRDLFQVRKRRKPQPRFPELPAMQK